MNVVAPYVLTALIERQARLVYVSSGMRRGGRPDLTDVDWSGARRQRTHLTCGSTQPEGAGAGGYCCEG